jgi:multiple sugar transport system substrate-binding protein
MFYNSDLLNKAGVEVPKDWWSFKKAAVKITQKDDKNKIKIAGAAIGLTDNVDHWSDIVGLMMKQNGVDTKNINSVESKTKLKDVFSFYTLFKTSDKVWDESLPNSTIFFASGNLGFYFGPSWRIFDIQSLNPNLKFETASMPQLPTNLTNAEISSGTELTNIHWSSYWTEGVNIKSENQQEAWKFIEYLSSPEVLENMYKAASQIRSFGLIYPRKSMVAKINSNSKLKPFVETANNASNWYLSSNTFDEGLNTSMQKYFSDAINGILINNNDSEEMTDTVISGILQLQQRYKLSK